MHRTLILYQEKNDNIEKIVKYVSLIVGNAKVCLVEEFSSTFKHCNLFVFGISLVHKNTEDKIIKFITENRDWLIHKRIVIFCYSRERIKGDNYVQYLENLLGESIIYSKILMGELLLDEIVDLALKLREVRALMRRKAPEEMVKKLLEDFLHNNNTCTLCTGVQDKVRGTPIEYFYSDGHIYMLTEGGEKFANILLNPKVSICIYNHKKIKNMLHGVQVTGTASLVNVNCREYNQIFRSRSLSSDKLVFFPECLNLLKIKLHNAEYLCYKFTEIGYDYKQDYIFNSMDS